MFLVSVFFYICRYSGFLWSSIGNNSKTKILELEQKISEQDNILNHVTHEIRTSIHGGSSIAQFLYENWDKMDEQEHIKYVGIIAKNNQQIITLINALLDLSKFSTGRMKFNFVAMDLLVSIKNVVQQLTELNVFNDKVNIILINHDITKAMISGDGIRINQLLNNLFNNALKYTKEGLIIAVINLKNYENNSYWCFSLIDTGIGIPNSELETIFEVFARSSRTNDDNIGDGLGLSICREIILAHKGYIYAENNCKKGTRVEFMIPVYDEKET
ncbi:MAG: HAMP domain-containing histidine kinase [Rickettsia endosymbiont of Pseudomimeciton antennatum]|nr:HAMP domain-containing histidine kinase [Rickettsia endosymbiont of Pseudomimeciton antennatum]MCC8397931.1 HAMP domain-containing histidine kinase [Rickettsia endosymbiont of Labidopullus appendiculatus]